jgi:molecular chaperone GrpE
MTEENPEEVLEEQVAEAPPEEDYKDKYLRAIAEAENSRKRLQKDKQEAVQYAQDRLLSDILQPIDNMENALRFAAEASPEVKNWAMGFEMILGQLKEVLASHGVKVIESVGKQLDPYQHEAVEIVETTDQPNGTILEEFAKGYRIGTRTIRPAQVKVAKN